MTEQQIEVMKNYISFLEKRLEHATSMHEQAMDMVFTLVGKLKSAEAPE